MKEVKHFIRVCVRLQTVMKIVQTIQKKIEIRETKEWSERWERKVNTLPGTLTHRNGTARTYIAFIHPYRRHTMKNEINAKTFFTYYGRIAIFNKSLNEQINACTILTLVSIAFFIYVYHYCYHYVPLLTLLLLFFLFHLLDTGDAMPYPSVLLYAHVIA